MAHVRSLPLVAALTCTLIAAALALAACGSARPRRPDPVPPSSQEAQPAKPAPEVTAAPRSAPGPEAPHWPTPPLEPGAFDFVEVFRSKSSVLLEQVPALAQERNLSCEAAAMRMVLEGRGLAVSEDEILARMDRDPDPHKGFRGNPDGPLHDPTWADYGTYAEEVARVLESFGAPARVVYGMSDDDLRTAVKQGQAVIVWMTRQPEPKVIEEDGYRLVEGEHAQVVIGLTTDGRFVAHDPWSVRPDSGREGTAIFPEIQQWDVFDRMAVVVPLGS